MKRTTLEAWMGFADGRPQLYAKDDDGKPVIDLFITKKAALKEYDDARPVRIEWRTN